MTATPFLVAAGGKVYKITGDSDNGSDITGDLVTSYNYFNDRAGIKRFSSVQPILEGETTIDFRLAWASISAADQPSRSRKSHLLQTWLNGMRRLGTTFSGVTRPALA